MEETLRAWQAALGRVPLAGAVRDLVWVKALTESMHIIALGIILYGVGVLMLRLTGLGGRRELAATVSRRFAAWIWGAMLVALLSGLLLLLGAGRRGLANPLFLVKMELMAAALLVTAVLQLTVRADTTFWELKPARRAGARILAPVCFILWMAAAFAGRWLAYSDLIFPPKY